MGKNISHSPLKLLGGAIKAYGAYSQKGKYQEEEARAQEEYDEMRGKYMGLDTSNLYGDVENPYANMQNTMEDLTVNQQQAQFQKQMFQQQQSNVLQGMRGAAGGSGAAGLAQAMMNQGQQQSQQASASIGQQESANQMARQQQAGQLQQQERAGGWQASMTRRAGAEQSRSLEKDKISTLFTMSTNRLASAKQAEQQREAEMWGGVSQALSPMDLSDRKLKRNIVFIKKSPSGLNIYNFEYKDSKFGKGIWQGVMSDEIPQEAVIKHKEGYDMVDYSKLDVDFVKIKF